MYESISKRPTVEPGIIELESIFKICFDEGMIRREYTIESDAVIIQRVIDGETNTYEQLMTRYQAHVLTIVKRHVPFEQVEETTQDVFIRVYKALKSFNRAEPFKPWLSTITLRTCYDFWRKHYRSKEVTMSSLSNNHHDWLDNLLSDHAFKSWRHHNRIEDARQILHWALSKLTAKERMVLTLTYLEGYTNREAGRLLGWSSANVKIKAFRARKKLQELLIKSEGR